MVVLAKRPKKHLPVKKAGIQKMPVGGRTLHEYFDVAALPLLALVAWSVAGFGLNYLSFSWWSSGFAMSITLLIELAAGVYIGFLSVEKFGGRVSDAAITGAVAGLVSGILIMFFELVRGNSVFALSSPFMSLLVVMVSASIGAWVFNKFMK